MKIERGASGKAPLSIAYDSFSVPCLSIFIRKRGIRYELYKDAFGTQFDSGHG